MFFDQMKTISICLLLIAQIFVACSKSRPAAAAVIRVTVGNPPTPHTNTGIGEIFTSYAVMRHTSQTLGLAKLWDVSEAEADNRLRRAIKLVPGSEPGLLEFEAHGLDHEIAVKILEELCTYPGTLGIKVAEGGAEQEVQISIVQPAK